MFSAEALMIKCSKDFKNVFLDSVDSSREEITLDENFSVKGFDRFVNSLSHFRPVILSTVSKSAKETEKPRETIELDLDSQLAKEELENHCSELITNISDVQRDSIRTIIKDGFDRNLSYKTVSERLKSQLGLNNQQIKILSSMENNLIENHVKQDQINKFLNIKSKQMLKIRADTIALTESAKAVSNGRYLIQQQMFKDGDIKESTKQKWYTASDERTCPLCGPLDNVEVGMNEYFTAINGSKIRNPILHPRCRCIVELEF